MKIACRFPGGMTIMTPGVLGAPHRIVRLDGPPNAPSALPPARSRGIPAVTAAASIRKSVAAALTSITDTADGPHGPHDYGVTEVPGDFWAAWLAQNREFDVVKKRMVFALE